VFKKWFFIIAFFFIICLPLTLQFLGLKIDSDFSENRTIQAKPVFSFNHYLNANHIISKISGFYLDSKIYRDKYNSYYQDNFPLKPILYQYYSSVQIDFFFKSPRPQNVVLGKGGWLFLSDYHSDVIKESKGINNFSEKELLLIKATLLERKEWLKNRGMEYYVAIAPNKHTVYGDFLPISKSRQLTKLEQLKKVLAPTELNFIDLSELYSQYPGKRLFHKTDSHWNDFGAYLAYKTLINNISYNKHQVASLTLDEFVIKTDVRYEGDLAVILNMKLKEDYISLINKNPIAFQVPAILPEPPNSYFYEERFKGSANELKVLIFRDSFSFALKEFLKESFGETVFIWNHKFDKELIEYERPNIIIHQIVERDLEVFLK
jgi:alginate O-acetyltransferase complex protein AlgJ